jgi:hypothetical protein
MGANDRAFSGKKPALATAGVEAGNSRCDAARILAGAAHRSATSRNPAALMRPPGSKAAGRDNASWGRSCRAVLVLGLETFAARAHVHAALIVHPNHQGAFSHGMAPLMHHFHHFGIGRHCAGRDLTAFAEYRHLALLGKCRRANHSKQSRSTE